MVIEQNEGDTSTSPSIFPMMAETTLTGSIQSDKTPMVEYKKQVVSMWNTATDVKTSDTSFSTTVSGLRSDTAYDYYISIDSAQTSNGSLTTAGETALADGGFEDWSQGGRQWNSWPSGETSFRGTDSPGATVFVGNLTTSTIESVSGRAVLLGSKDAVVRLGVGDIFTDDLALDGTNGVLQLNRPFTSFPTPLKFQYKYASTTVDRIGQDVGGLGSLRSRPNSRQVYIALPDKP